MSGCSRTLTCHWWVFGSEIEICPACGGAERIIARIHFDTLYFQPGRTHEALELLPLLQGVGW